MMSDEQEIIRRITLKLQLIQLIWADIAELELKRLEALARAKGKIRAEEVADEG